MLIYFSFVELFEEKKKKALSQLFENVHAPFIIQG